MSVTVPLPLHLLVHSIGVPEFSRVFGFGCIAYLSPSDWVLRIIIFHRHAPTPSSQLSQVARAPVAFSARRESFSFPHMAAAGKAPMPVPPADAASDGPVSPFKQKQNLMFQVVSMRVEDWSERTYCGRILLRNGSEMEVQATKAALDQWNNVPKFVAHTAEIMRSVLKPYKGADKTGIDNTLFLRTQFRIPSLQRAVATFPLHHVQTRDMADPGNLDQIPEDTIFNIGGYVHHVEAGQAESGSALARRKVVLLNGEWQTTVDFLGALTRSIPPVESKVAIFGVKKRVWQGIMTLETTRLSWCLEAAPWLHIVKAEEGAPLRKALRSEVLPAITIQEVKQSDGQEATCVQATMAAFAEDVLDATLWVGQAADRMRLPVTLRDATGNLSCTLWSSEFGPLIKENIDELSVLYAACENGQEAKQAFLDALNANADKAFRWTLRPRFWEREKHPKELQWHVACVQALNE